MKYYELKQIATFLSNFQKIFSLYRVDDNIIKFIFDKFEPIYVDLKRGNSTFFMCENYINQRNYNAPFDVLLVKFFTRSYIKKVEILQNNRILRLHVSLNLNYKSTNMILQLEFTGKNTNAIILNEQNIVIEALRHVDSKMSFRSVIVGEELLALPEIEFCENEKKIENITEFLYQIYKKNQQTQIEILKANKHYFLLKKINRLQKELDKLPNVEELRQKALKLNEHGSLVLANLSLIKSYSKEVVLKDFEQNEVKIIFPKEAKSPQQAANFLFSASKKIKQKSNSIYIEKDNLNEKINFYKRLDEMILSAKTLDEIHILAPKQQNKNKNKIQEIYESFYVQDYKIMVGKSEKSNIALIKNAKKSDIWLHIKQIPSSHVIVRTSKQNLPQSVLEFAAKLCVNFSNAKKGLYLVDYTKWQYVKIQSGSNVFYTNYKTIKINKE